MPIQAPIAPSAAPATPDRKDRATFSNRVDAGLAYVATAVIESKSLADCAYANAQESVTQANAAAAQATAATAQANTAAASAAAAVATSNAAAFVGATVYAQNANAISQINFKTYRRKTAGQSATDPANDVANWENISGDVAGLKLLATITPTASPFVDVVNVFSALYDRYIVHVDGVSPVSSGVLRYRAAAAGVVDAGSNYHYTGNGIVTSLFVNSASAVGTLSGLNATLEFINVNSVGSNKSIDVSSTVQYSASPAFSEYVGKGYYLAASAMSGFRLFWDNGSNFQARGVIRIYGVSKL